MNIVLFITNQCNLNCKYCFVSKNKDMMTMDTYIKVINDFKDSSKHLTFFGGEPLLYINRIKEIIEYNEKNNIKMKYNLNTNALLLQNEILDYCISKKFLLNVSLDGNKTSNLINRCNEEQFEIILNNIKNAISKGGKVIVNYVIDPSNIAYYYDSINYLITNDITDICLMINYEALWKKKDIEFFQKQQNKVIDLLIQNDNITIHPIESKIAAISTKEEIKKCNFGNENVVVGTNGDYYPCMSYAYNKEYLITPKRNKFRNTVDITKCIKCKYLPYCSNNCMCKYSNINKDSEINPNCEFEKIFIKFANDYMIKKINDIIDNIQL